MTWWSSFIFLGESFIFLFCNFFLVKCIKFAWKWPIWSGEENFKNLKRFFNLITFTFIWPLKGTWPFIWRNFEALSPRMLYYKFCYFDVVVLKKVRNVEKGGGNYNDDEKRSTDKFWSKSSGVSIWLRWANKGVIPFMK